MVTVKEEYELKCSECGEFLHVRVVGTVGEHEGRRIKQFRQEVFCPACGHRDKIFNQFKHNRNEKKKQDHNRA